MNKKLCGSERGRHRGFRRFVTFLAVCSVAAGSLLTVPRSAAAEPLDRSIELDIPEGSLLEPALMEWAVKIGAQVMMNSEAVRSEKTAGLHGFLPAAQALSELLRGTGLTYNSDGRTIHIIAATAVTQTSLAQTSGGSGRPNSASMVALKKAAPDVGLEEVVVTAQKRQERLQDVPVPVAVVSAEELVENNQLLLREYSSNIPGLSVTSQSSGSFQTLSIRGITTGVYSNPTVGISVDDVPFGTSTTNGGGGSGQIVPDIDPGDLARVEVLRGPQGTLYGASSMGGLLKFVTVDPSTEKLTGRVEADVNGVYHGAQAGYGARASFNIPLTDTLAVRVSGFARQDPGFIDNVQTGQRGVNEAQASGGRLSAVWRPTDTLALKLSALYQDVKGYGQPDVDIQPGLGDLQQSHLPGTGGYDRKVQAYSATLTAKLGSSELTATTGYNVVGFNDSYDLSFLADSYDTQGLYGVTGLFSTEHDSTKKVTQEVRLAMPLAERLEWLVGGFYTYEKSDFRQSLPAADATSGVVAGVPLMLGFPPTFMEIAAFTDLTVKVTSQFDVQFGGRESQIRQTFSDFFAGAVVPSFYGSPSPYIQPELDSKAKAFTYLVTPRLKVSDDLMIYARLASGYRAGGANYSVGPGAPTQYDPDKTYNYEIGLKGDFLEHRLSIDTSLYYIDWKQIQLTELNPETGLGYLTNASRAKSDGLELSVESRPLTGLKLSAWIVYGDAVLKAGFPANSSAYGASGDRLPYSSRFSGNVSIQQDFPVSSSATVFAGATVSYAGNREGEFTQSPQRQYFPGYAKTDLRVGAEYGPWTTNLFVNNVADRRGAVYGGLGAFPPFGFVYIQPRTAGLSMTRKF